MSTIDLGFDSTRVIVINTDKYISSTTTQITIEFHAIFLVKLLSYEIKTIKRG